MSDTPTDWAKITQMLDIGWIVQVARVDAGGYFVMAKPPTPQAGQRAAHRLEADFNKAWADEAEPIEYDAEYDWITDSLGDNWLCTDDFTPGQALTRMAYKVFGEII